MAASDRTHPTTMLAPFRITRDVARRGSPRTAFLLAIAFTLLAPLPSAAAGMREVRRNFIGSELGGRNIISLNAERMITNQFGLGGGIGLGGYVYTSWVSGETHSRYLSVGGAWIPGLFDSNGVLLLQGSVGYQFQSSGGFFMRPLVCLHRRMGVNPGFFVLPGLTVGGTF